MHGQFLESFRYHPLLIPAAVIIGMNFVLWLLYERKPRWFNSLLWLLAVAVVALYAVRLILFFPRTEPMLYNQMAVLPRIIRFIRGLWTT